MPIGNQLAFEVIKAELLYTELVLGEASLFNISFQPTVCVITAHPTELLCWQHAVEDQRPQDVVHVPHASSPGIHSRHC